MSSPRLAARLCAATLALGACSSEERVNPVGGTTSSTGAGGAGTGGGGVGGGGASANGGGGSGVGGGAAGGGAGGSAGGGGGGGAVGGGGAGGSGGGLGADCDWGDVCGPGFYCDAAGCGMGQCAVKPSPAGEQKQEDPVCGCDGVTYWNANIAAIHGVAVASAGACPGGTAIACSSASPCPAGASCKKLVADAASCGADAGECWQTPFACDLAGAKARACTTQTCELECSLVQSNNAWYDDGTCP